MSLGSLGTGNEVSTGPMYAALGCPDCHINFGSGGCVPCEPGYTMEECQGCFDAPEKESFFARHEIGPQIISAILIAVATGVTMHQLHKRGLKTA